MFVVYFWNSRMFSSYMRIFIFVYKIAHLKDGGYEF